jgi:ADP-ribose pyrophosphatase
MNGNTRRGDRVLATGRFLKLVDRRGWEYVERSGATGVVVIVALLENERLLLVEQHRPALDARVIELPAGLVGDIAGQEDEPFERAAHRELLEETGFEAEQMTFLAEGPSSSGLCSEMYSFYQAQRLVRRNAGGGDESEDISVHEAPLEGLRAWLAREHRRGARIDPRIYAGLALVGQPLR